MLPYPSEVAPSDMAGEQPIVTNAMEARGHDVNQEAADELIRRYRHGLVARAAPTSIVFPLKRHTAFIVCDEPSVGYSDSVGITGQVSQHGLRSRKRTLGIHHPVDLALWVEVRFKGLGIGEV